MKTVGNPFVMKEINANIVRDALRGEKKATKQKLAELTGLSAVTIGSILNQLVEDKEVVEMEFIPSNGGRPARTFSYNAEFGHVLILYTHMNEGKDTVYCNVINFLGVCVYEENFFLETICLNSFEPVIERIFQQYPTIKAIGFGLPGMEYDHVMMTDDYENLNGVFFSKHYEEKYHVPVIVENDVNLAVSGYYYSNGYKEDKTIVYIYFPEKYEPGAGIFLKSRLHRGMNHFAGEIKYLPVRIDWKTIEYSNFEQICDAITALVLCFTCILNPDEIVLCGDFLTEAHIQSVVWNSEQKIEKLFLPKISISTHFDCDFKTGLAMETLELIKYKKITE